MKKIFVFLFVLCNLTVGETMSGKAFQLLSNAFQNGQQIPPEYTCNGANVSPQLSWRNAPDGTKSFVLIVDDPDARAVGGKTFVHWIVINIPTEVTELSKNMPIRNIGHAQELLNDFKKTTYGGPCPPDKQHTYRFTLFALKSSLLDESTLEAPFTAEQFQQAMGSAILGQAQLKAPYAQIK